MKEDNKSQYLDKNNQVIKEGDFVRFKDGDTGDVFVGEIVYTPEFVPHILHQVEDIPNELYFLHPKETIPLRAISHTVKTRWGGKIGDYLEIIGNKNNNPELVKQLLVEFEEEGQGVTQNNV